jgi:RNA recognition motif-containing protein
LLTLESQLQEHLNGKRHKKIESIKQEREKSAKRSLFVSGLRKDTCIKQLDDHFIRFGKINKIVIDQDKVGPCLIQYSFVRTTIDCFLLNPKNQFAIIEYESEESVEKALEFKGYHHVFEKNLKVSRRQLKEFVSRIANNGEKKKEILEKAKEEALEVNKMLAQCETVGT